jgi:hypothetical protein
MVGKTRSHVLPNPRIVGSQIEAKNILKSNDSRIDCTPPFNLVEMIEKDLNFQEFEEFEGFFLTR